MEHVMLGEIASRLGMDRSHARRYALKKGFKFVSVRAKSGQLAIALTPLDADELASCRVADGFLGGEVAETRKSNGHTSFVFYAVALMPDALPNRIKFGFTQDIDRRMIEYRTSCPGALPLKVWRCAPAWERAATAFITSKGCSLVGGEVYDCDDVASTLNRADRFFEELPEYNG